jgi:hypothetical protein
MKASDQELARVPSYAQWLQNGIWLAIIQFLIIAALFWADIHHHIYVSKRPYLSSLGGGSLRTRGLRWKDVATSKNRRGRYPATKQRALLVIERRSELRLYENTIAFYGH